MLAQELVSDLIPVTTVKETVQRVREHMTEWRVAHLPMADDSGYLGLLSETDLVTVVDPSRTVDTLPIQLLKVSVFDNQHIYEVIELISRYELTLLPVLNASNDYLGSIMLPSLVRHFNMLTAAGQPGAILVLSLAPQDYSPTILSRIIEENNAKMISLYTMPDPNGRELLVTIKVNTLETSSIIRTFDRYGYSVKSYHLANSQLDDFYRSRYEEFMKYMNI
jgi:CBS domain-containing protein